MSENTNDQGLACSKCGAVAEEQALCAYENCPAQVEFNRSQIKAAPEVQGRKCNCPKPLNVLNNVCGLCLLPVWQIGDSLFAGMEINAAAHYERTNKPGAPFTAAATTGEVKYIRQDLYDALAKELAEMRSLAKTNLTNQKFAEDQLASAQSLIAELEKEVKQLKVALADGKKW